MGPLNGMSEIEMAMDAPMSAAISDWQSGSADITVVITVTSFLKSCGKSGRIGLSIEREVKIACSEGRASRRVKLPGIFPTL